MSSYKNGNCIAFDTVFIQVDALEILIPTAFSPNGDGQNDLFNLIDKNISEFILLRIYNRWSELLFETNDFLHGWNGLFKGKEQDIDTYIYYLEVITTEQKSVNASGTFVLIR